MDGVYIAGMEMPKEGFVEIIIRDDGTVQQTGQSYRVDGTDYYTPYVGEMPVMYKAVPVPAHGRLIDESEIDLSKYEKAAHDALHNGKGSILYDSGVLAGARAITQLVRRAPTVIPASEGET